MGSYIGDAEVGRLVMGAEDPGASMSSEELSTSMYAFVVVCYLRLTMDAAMINTPTNALTSLPL